MRLDRKYLAEFVRSTCCRRKNGSRREKRSEWSQTEPLEQRTLLYVTGGGTFGSGSSSGSGSTSGSGSSSGGGSSSGVTSSTIDKDFVNSITFAALPGIRQLVDRSVEQDLVRFSPDRPGLASNFTAIINWGDGAETRGVVRAIDGVFAVSGQHTYSEVKTFEVDIRIFWMSSAGLAKSQHQTTVTIHAGDQTESNLGLRVIPREITAVEDTPLASTTTLAVIIDSRPLAERSTLPTATIDWQGGGGPSGLVSASVELDGTFNELPVYAVRLTGLSDANRTFTEIGTFEPRITVSTGVGVSRSVAGSLLVQQSKIQLTAALEGTISGNTLSGTIARFSDTATPSSAGEYSAFVRWGDGKEEWLPVTADGTPGHFRVDGTHYYVLPRGYTVLVRVFKYVAGGTIQDLGARSQSSFSITVTGTAPPGSVMTYDINYGSRDRSVLSAGKTIQKTASVNGSASLTNEVLGWVSIPFATTSVLVQILWGDSNAPYEAGSIDAAGNIRGSHVYSHTGSFGIRNRIQGLAKTGMLRLP